MNDRNDIASVIDFWRQVGPTGWFRKDDAFDRDFKARFETLHWRAARRELDHWQESAEGAFALMILLDQYPRNSFRNTGHMYATDALALHHARLALDAGHDMAIEQAIRVFFYLPFSHSEALADQELAYKLNLERLVGEFHEHAKDHRDIVARFGRFPHRNPILARQSTPEELEFLAEGGFSG
ncbi:MAG: DUF924 family protein [Mesorhizobium sp.]